MSNPIRTQFWPGLLITLLGLVVIIGWLTHNAVLAQVMPAYPAMVVNAAICFMLLGCAFILPSLNIKACALLRMSIGVIVTIIAGMVLFETIFDISLGIDFSDFHTWLAVGCQCRIKNVQNGALKVYQSRLINRAV